MTTLTRINVALAASTSVQEAEIEAMQIELDGIKLTDVITKALREELDKHPQLKGVKINAALYGG